MKVDRNAVADLLTILRNPRDAELETIRAYWDEPREPWGAVVVCGMMPGPLVLAVMGPKGLGLPGGKGDLSESPRDAARRELREETGLAVAEGDLKELPTFVADNGVLTYAFELLNFDCQRWGMFRSSPEGAPCWVSPHELMRSRFARFPEYNRKILNHLGYKG